MNFPSACHHLERDSVRCRQDDINVISRDIETAQSYLKFRQIRPTLK